MTSQIIYSTPEPKNHICQFCNCIYKQTNHQVYCNKNPNAKVRTSGNQYTKSKKTGQPYIVKDETRLKLKEANTGKKHKPETIQKIRDTMKRVVSENPESYRGRYNRGIVKNIVCSNGFNVLGSWELKFVEFCIEHNIKLEQPITGFEYEWFGTRIYYPDFYLPDLNIFVEIKGFKTERDDKKWQSMLYIHNQKLLVIDKSNIKNLDWFYKMVVPQGLEP